MMSTVANDRKFYGRIMTEYWLRKLLVAQWLSSGFNGAVECKRNHGTFDPLRNHDLYVLETKPPIPYRD